MKVDAVIAKETRRIAVGQLVCSLMMVAVYLIISKLSASVVLGILLGDALAIGNFFLMGLTVQKAVNLTDEGQRSKIMQVSQSLRLLLLAALIIVGVAVLKLDVVAVLVPLFFTRITIYLVQICTSKKNNHPLDDGKDAS